MDNIKALGIPRRHQPAKIVEFKVQQGDSVDKQTPLLTYEYKQQLTEDDAIVAKALHKQANADGTYNKREYLRTPFEGTVSSIECKVGDTVHHGTELVLVQVACGHGAVFNGLCGLCGKDVSGMDTSGVPDAQATIDMFHEATGLKVSSEMAAVIAKDTKKNLWKQKKLSLIIDLDQTIIHATETSNPEFEAWLIDNYPGTEVNGKDVSKADTNGADGGADNVDASPSESKPENDESKPDTGESKPENAESNPGTDESKVDNAESKPENDGSNPDTDSTNGEETNAERQLPSDICTFYLPRVPSKFFVKLRPGLREFLHTISQYYEMHIYTMGTRPYADAVAAAIDPDRQYFNHRILSRDESGSMVEKSMQRLFPVDTSMVAILDDRDDVWKWSPNLIRVHPYEFFKGVGDINAGMLGQHKAAVPLEHTAVGESNTGNHPQASEDGVRAEPEAAGKQTYLTDRDRELMILETVLIKIHSQYYEQLDQPSTQSLPDLADILSAEKQHVLRGMTIVFSAVFPIGAGALPPHQNELWWRAQSFGARCELEITDKTTHVVAGKPGTEKVHAARRKHARTQTPEANVPIVVKPKWLMDSIFQWTAVDETAYLWYPEDKPTVDRFRELNMQRDQPGSSSGSPKRKSEDKGPPVRKQPRHMSVRRVQQLGGLESTNTTDIEDELERQEAGLGYHEAEVNSFVQNIDWDDLEREAMGDSESDASSRPQTPDSDSRADAAPDSLRQAAMRQAARQISDGRTSDNEGLESSDVFTESSSGDDDELSEHHRMKRRRTSIQSSTADNDPHEGDSDGKGTTRSRMAKRMGISLARPSTHSQDARSSGDSSGDEYYENDRNVVKEPLFAGIEDEQGEFVDDEFANASQADDDHVWGEDDESDEENFDDLINNLEEEISSP
ncbi:CTD phosphatase Fcp1 [Coemansia sp. RSA 1591]|nr:CTD phosphatase Fcp1 [Coemansia sp. RSA 1591]